MTEAEPKYGVVRSLPLTCACGHVGNWVYMRWCGACGEAICPSCFPASEAHTYPYRCARCLNENRELALVIAARESAEKREAAFIRAIFSDETEALQADEPEVVTNMPIETEARNLSRKIIAAIVKDLGDRRGIGPAWDQLPDDVRAETVAEWERFAEAVLDAAQERDGP